MKNIANLFAAALLLSVSALAQAPKPAAAQASPAAAPNPPSAAATRSQLLQDAKTWLAAEKEAQSHEAKPTGHINVLFPTGTVIKSAPMYIPPRPQPKPRATAVFDPVCYAVPFGYNYVIPIPADIFQLGSACPFLDTAILPGYSLFGATWDFNVTNLFLATAPMPSAIAAPTPNVTTTIQLSNGAEVVSSCVGHVVQVEWDSSQTVGVNPTDGVTEFYFNITGSVYVDGANTPSLYVEADQYWNYSTGVVIPPNGTTICQ